MPRRNTERSRPLPAQLQDHGFTLIEVLLAVTLIAVISLSFMGYFTTAMERSMDNSRRITAANLARMKAEEIKADFALVPEYPAAALSKFGKLSAELRTGSVYTIDRDKAAAGGKVSGLFTSLLEPSRPVDDGSRAGGGAVYHYEVELSKLQSDRTTQLEAANQALFALHMGDRLIRMVVTVSWTAGEAAMPHPRRRIRLDTYLAGS